MPLRLLFIPLVFAAILIVACDSNPYKQGHAIYDYYCASCHMEDGSGLEGLIPPLAQADWVAENQDQLACIIRYGMEGAIVVNGKTYNQPMAGIPELRPAEITNVINYINHAWGNDYGFVPDNDVEAALEECTE